MNDNGKNQPGDRRALLGVAKDGGFPNELMTVSKSVEEAIGRTVILDDRQLCAVSALYRKLIKFNNVEGLKTLKFWLDGRPAIAGHNRSLATQAHTGFFFPEASGTKLDKAQRESLSEMYKSRSARDDNNHENASV